MYRRYLKLGVSTFAMMVGAGFAAEAQQANTQVATVEQVVVTGSRVITNGNDMPTPVTVLSPDVLSQTTPSNIMDGLEALPDFAGSQSPQSNPGNSSQNNAAHEVNLRDLGVTRTLVLYDGRRIASDAPTGQIDTDIIPQMLLQRVDVVTGGASAVYGSDAVAGVVNFITNKSFDGIQAKGHAGVSQYGDGREENLGIAGGMDILGGHGHIEASYEWFNNDGIAGTDKLNRQWAKDVWSVQGAGTKANPYHLVENTRLSSTSFSGVIQSGPLSGQEFTSNGFLSPFQHGASVGAAGVESGGDGGYYYQASLVSALASNQAFGRFDYDFTDDLHAYAEYSYTKIHNENIHQTNEFRNITLGAQNAFLLPAYQATMAAAGATSFTFSKMMMQAPPLNPDTWTTGNVFNAGLNGSFGGYKWDLSYVYNGNQQFTRNNANIDLQKAYAALDAVVAPSGQVVCNVTLTNPGLYPGCTPLNLFGPTSENAAALNYILAVTKYNAQTDMNDVGADISGSPFDDWAGPVQMALSGEWHVTTFDLNSNAQPTSHANCTGLRFNCTPSTLLYISNILESSPSVSQSVSEGALEVDAPLLKELPFAELIDFNGAIRYADYDTSGDAITWKLGTEWHVDDELSIRGTRSRDIRAPNLNELFAPQLVNPAGATDVHTGIVGQAPYITNSNPDLKPEVAMTWTAGAVYRPAWLEDFSIALDFFQIKINNAVTTLQGQSTTIQNICEASNGASPLCALIVRPLSFSNRTPANFPTAFLSEPENAQTVKTQGIDLEANYQTDLGPGHFAVRVLGTYQPMLETIQFPGAPVLNTAGAPGLPSVRTSIFLKYIWQDFALDILERVHNGTAWNTDRTLIYAMPNLPAAAYTNATLTYNWDPAQFYISVQNVFNKQPTPYGGVGGASGVPGLFGGFVPGDDAIGRYFIAGFRLKM